MYVYLCLRINKFFYQTKFNWVRANNIDNETESKERTHFFICCALNVTLFDHLVKGGHTTFLCLSSITLPRLVYGKLVVYYFCFGGGEGALRVWHEFFSSQMKGEKANTYKMGVKKETSFSHSERLEMHERL